MIGVLIALGIGALAAPPIMRALGARGFYVLALMPAGALVWLLLNWPTAGAEPTTQTFAWVPSL